MFNINLDFKNLNALLDSKFFLSFLALCACLFCLLVGLSLGASSKQDVCKEEFFLIEEQRRQLQKMELDHGELVKNCSTDCIQRETQICRKEKEAIKTNCNDLLDKLGVDSRVK